MFTFLQDSKLIIWSCVAASNGRVQNFYWQYLLVCGYVLLLPLLCRGGINIMACELALIFMLSV